MGGHREQRNCCLRMFHYDQTSVAILVTFLNLDIQKPDTLVSAAGIVVEQTPMQSS